MQAVITERGKANGNFKPNQVEIDRINFFLDWIEWLAIPPGGYEYRSLLLIFRKNLEVFPKLVVLLFSCRTTLFEPEDKVPYLAGRIEIPSLMLSFARKLAAAWLGSELLQQIPLIDIRQFFGQVRKEVQDRQHTMWLDYDEAKCLIKSGNLVDARELIVPVLKRKQSESWAWGALATTYVRSSPDTAITLFAHAITQSRDEKFALKPLKGIASLLAAKGDTQQASMCIERVVNFYQQNGWHLQSDLIQIQQQLWFDPSAALSELPVFLQQQAEGALDLLHGPIKKVCGLVVNLHKSGKGLHLYISMRESISIPLRVIKGRTKPKAGDYLLITLAGEGDDKTVLSAEATSPQELSGVEVCKNELCVTSKGFGFVDDTFIPPFLIKEGMNKKTVEVLRYKDFDKKKGKMGWRALSLEVCE